MSRAPSPHGLAPRSTTASQRRHGVLGHDHQLDALLPGVARAIDHHLDPGHLAHLEREGRRLVETEALERARALHGEQRELVGLVAQVGAGAAAPVDPLEVGLAVRRVDDEEEAARLDPVDDQVVDDPAACSFVRSVY